MTPAPLTEHHTCDACGCHVPVDRYAEHLRGKLTHALNQLRDCRQAAKRARREGR